MPEVDRARRRRIDQHGAAALRAVSARPTADLRHGRLAVGDRSVPIVAPHLGDDHDTLTRSRGRYDALGVRLRFSDLELHEELSPDGPLERLIFDLCEQLRCEVLIPPTLFGVRSNVDAAFREWCADARAHRVEENGLALIVYTVAHMVRARLGRALVDPEVDTTIESTRGALAPLIGDALRELPGAVHDQAAYALAAAEIARLVGDLAGDTTTVAAGIDALRLVVPLEWLGGEQGTESTRSAASGVGDYQVFTTAFDELTTGVDLYSEPVRTQLRDDLDRRVAAQAVSIPRVAQRLRRHLAVDARDGWHYGLEDGLVDPSRLGQLVSNPDRHLVFRRERYAPSADAVVSFLVDTSGSMKAQQYEAVAVLVDTYCRALDLAGAASEVLGFTTGGWAGGRAVQQWRRAGQPASPGRLNETLHIVYKDAETSWRRARRSIASMLRTDHYREGVDGEALSWAHDRLLARTEHRRLLVVISDGAPMDAATANTNGVGLLHDHLRSVADDINRRSPVELGAIGIDLDVTDFFANAVSLELSDALRIGDYAALETLFRPGRR